MLKLTALVSTLLAASLFTACVPDDNTDDDTMNPSGRVTTSTHADPNNEGIEIPQDHRPIDTDVMANPTTVPCRTQETTTHGSTDLVATDATTAVPHGTPIPAPRDEASSRFEATKALAERDDVCKHLPSDGVCSHFCDEGGITAQLPQNECVIVVCDLDDGKSIKTGGCNF